MTEKEKLLNMIEESPVVQRYKTLEEKINQSKDIKRQINQLKAIQKQLINAKHIGKTEAIKQFQKDYDERLESVEAYPLMAEYLSLQEEINEMLQTVLAIIEDTINNEN